MENPELVIRACIFEVRTGRTDAAHVLADVLEEIDHPKAKELRAACNRHAHWINLFSAGRPPRRGYMLWEEFAVMDRWLRDKVARIFGKRWPKKKLALLSNINGRNKEFDALQKRKEAACKRLAEQMNREDGAALVESLDEENQE